LTEDFYTLRPILEVNPSLWRAGKPPIKPGVVIDYPGTEEEQLMNNKMFAAFLKWAATQEPSKGLSRLINKLWGMFLEESTEGDVVELSIDSTLLKLGLAKKTGRGAGATLTYKGVK
jgi:hypothetical protein